MHLFEGNFLPMVLIESIRVTNKEPPIHFFARANLLGVKGLRFLPVRSIDSNRIPPQICKLVACQISHNSSVAEAMNMGQVFRSRKVMSKNSRKSRRGNLPALTCSPLLPDQDKG